MKKFLRIRVLIFISFAFFSVPIFVFSAEEAQPIVDVSFPGATAGTADPSSYIKSLYQFGVGIAGILAVGMIVAGAIFYSISGAVDKKNEGKDMIYSAIWGLVLLLGSYLILKTINPQLVTLGPPGGDLGRIELPANCKEKDENGNPTGLAPCLPNQSPLTTTTSPTGEIIQTCQCYNKPPGCLQDIIDSCQPRRVDVTRDLQILVPDCFCETGGYNVIPWFSVSTARIEPTTLHDVSAGGAYWQYPYYAKIGGPESAKCINFAWRKEPEGGIRKANLGGLKPC